MLLQVMVYKDLIISVFAAFFLRLLSGYFFISIIKDQFFNNYIKVVYYLALLSLIFQCMVFFFQPFLNIFYFIYENIVLKISLIELASRPNIIIYTFNSGWLNDDIFRNAGFAWEPGAFGLFCCLAMFFNLIANNLKSSPSKRLQRACILGSSFRQGTHHVAQKLITTT